MLRRPPRSTLFPTRRSSDLRHRFGLNTPSPAGGGLGWEQFTGAPDSVVASGRRRLEAAPHSHVKMLAQEHSPMTIRSEEHTSELQSQSNLVCRLLLEKKKKL